MKRGRKRWAKRVIGVSIVILGVLLLTQVVNGYFFSSKAVMHLSGARFEVTLADNQKTRTKGLSGTKVLPADHAMVFVFDYPSQWSIWMKEMNFPIDIVWLDDSKRVVHLVTNVPPESYPNKTFSPAEPARYVVEFRSGTVSQKGIKIGQEAVFSGTSRKL